MMRAFTVAAVAALLLTACASSEEPAVVTTVPPELGPGEVVEAWIDAVISSDAGELMDLVEPGGLVMLAAVENRFSEDETMALLEGGVPLEFVREYWTSFRSGFADFAGIPIQSIEVGDHDEFLLGEVRFASVTIGSGDVVTPVMVAWRDGVWRLDLVGSFGAAFAAQLRRMLVGLSSSTTGDRLREAYRSDVLPGLLAAFRRDPANSVLGAELERMALLLER